MACARHAYFIAAAEMCTALPETDRASLLYKLLKDADGTFTQTATGLVTYVTPNLLLLVKKPLEAFLGYGYREVLLGYDWRLIDRASARNRAVHQTGVVRNGTSHFPARLITIPRHDHFRAGFVLLQKNDA